MRYLFNIRNMNKYIWIRYRDGIIKHLGVTNLSELKLDQNKCVQNKNNNNNDKVSAGWRGGDKLYPSLAAVIFSAMLLLTKQN